MAPESTLRVKVVQNEVVLADYTLLHSKDFF